MRYRRPAPAHIHDKDFFRIFESIASNIELETLLSDLAPKLMDFTDSQCGAFYLANNATGKLELKFSSGFSRAVYAEFDLSIGEGLVGSAASMGDVTVIGSIPADSAFVMKTFLGTIAPKNVMLVPVSFQDKLMGVLALASLYPYTQRHRGLIGIARPYIGAAISNSVAYGRSMRLAAELTFQNKLIADLNNDLENKLAERSALLNRALGGVMDCAMVVAGTDGVVVFWNTGAELLYGIPASNAIGRSADSVFGRGSEARAALFRYKADYAIQHDRYDEKGWRTARDGSRIYLETTLMTIRGENAETPALAFITRDLTRFM